ncbi:MAG: LysE family transporter [Parachlamydia sp.]|nr:LysE family transporter [Parachlamydia sp.]
MIIAVAIVSLLAAISPGPDFFIVLRNSLSYSRKAGLLTALGVSLALVIHLSYTLVGIGVVIAESPFLYHLVKYTGVAYLFYLGLTGLLSSFKKQSSMNLAYAASTTQISASKALLQGFLTNLLNPKCALFFISLFSQFIDTNTPVATRIEYAAINWSVSLGWFLLLAYMVTGKLLMGRIDRFRLYIDRTMGGALMMLSMKMLLA